MFATQSWTFIRQLQSILKEQGGYFSFSIIHPHRKGRVKSYHCAIEDNQAIEASLNIMRLMNQLGWGCYLGIASRRRGLRSYQRGGKKALQALPALFVDMDLAPAEAQAVLKGVLPASLVVSSGNGLHAYWFLEKASQDFVLADQILKGLAGAIQSDKSMSVDQVLRLPGFWHNKDSQALKACKILASTPHRYHLEDFYNYLPKVVPSSVIPATKPRRRSHLNFKRNTQRHLNPTLLKTLLAELRQRYQASPYRGQGWYKCLCIYPHQHDYPGCHAYYHCEKGLYHCFGRHGQKLAWEIARDLQVDIDATGGLWQA
ncbi:MAG: hypothetical protein WBC91_19775 [Phototrophicaceae bacterium]